MPRELRDTSTTHAARADARAQAGRRGALGPTVPASDAHVVDRHGSPVPSGSMLWEDVVRPGGCESKVLPRGAILRLTDLEGDACANVLVYNARNPLERLNVADTVKVQWQAYLGPGSLVLSDMGRVLMSIVADDAGRHDAFCGASNRAANERKYGIGDAHSSFPNARDRFAVALAKHGLGRQDIAPNVNFFKGVRIGPDGELEFDGSPTAAGRRVELRAELDVLVVVANTPHVLDPRPDYHVTPVRVSAWRDAPTTRADDAWSATPEAERAFLQTEELVLAGGCS